MHSLVYSRHVCQEGLGSRLAATIGNVVYMVGIMQDYGLAQLDLQTEQDSAVVNHVDKVLDLTMAGPEIMLAAF